MPEMYYEISIIYGYDKGDGSFNEETFDKICDFAEDVLCPPEKREVDKNGEHVCVRFFTIGGHDVTEEMKNEKA